MEWYKNFSSCFKNTVPFSAGLDSYACLFSADATQLPAKRPSWLLRVALERSWFFRVSRNGTRLDFKPLEHIWCGSSQLTCAAAFVCTHCIKLRQWISEPFQDAVFMLWLSGLEICSEARSEAGKNLCLWWTRSSPQRARASVLWQWHIEDRAWHGMLPLIKISAESTESCDGWIHLSRAVTHKKGR